MSPKTLSAVKLASQCFTRTSSPAVAVKSFTSYSKPAQSYFDMYNEPSPLSPSTSSTELRVSNNGIGSIVRGEMTFIDNAEDDAYSIPDTPFVPTVSSADETSGQGHRSL